MILTYHNSAAVKQERINRCKAHIEADRLIGGSYGADYRGKFQACAIGCQVYYIAQANGLDWKKVKDKHILVAADYGWPVWLCWVEDRVFGNLPPERQKTWPLELVSAVPVGVDLAPVRHALLAFIAREVVAFDRDKYHDVAKASDDAAALHERMAQGNPVSDEEWSAAKSAAKSAAESEARAAWAAWSAAWAAEGAAEGAAWAAEFAAKSAAARAAWAAESEARAAWRAAARAAWSAAWIKMADKLIELMKSA